MSWPPHEIIVAASCLCWLVIVIAGAIFFDRNRNAPLKRRLWPAWIAASSLSFIAAVCAALGHISAVVIAIALAVGLINLLAQKFCPACGLSQYAKNPFRSDNKCTECGGALSRAKPRAPHFESS